MHFHEFIFPFPHNKNKAKISATYVYNFHVNFYFTYIKITFNIIVICLSFSPPAAEYALLVLIQPTFRALDMLIVAPFWGNRLFYPRWNSLDLFTALITSTGSVADCQTLA